MTRGQDLAKSGQELVGRLNFEALVNSAEVPPPLMPPVRLDECRIAQQVFYGKSLVVCARKVRLRKRSVVYGRELIEPAFIDHAFGDSFGGQTHQELVCQLRAMPGKKKE